MNIGASPTGTINGPGVGEARGTETSVLATSSTGGLGDGKAEGDLDSAFK